MEHEKLAKVMEFCDQSHNLAPDFYEISALFANIKKFIINLETAFSALFRKML